VASVEIAPESGQDEAEVGFETAGIGSEDIEFNAVPNGAPGLAKLGLWGRIDGATRIPINMTIASAEPVMSSAQRHP